MRLIKLAALTVLSFVVVIAASAQDVSNDPVVNPDANACYTGGTLEGKCITDDDWIAGWHLIRWEAGLITGDEMPALLRYVLPKGSRPDGGVCYEGVDTGLSSWLFDADTYGGYVFMPTNNCYTPGYTYGTAVVATTAEDADAKCAAIQPGTTAYDYTFWVRNETYNNYWLCF